MFCFSCYNWFLTLRSSDLRRGGTWSLVMLVPRSHHNGCCAMALRAQWMDQTFKHCVQNATLELCNWLLFKAKVTVHQTLTQNPYQSWLRSLIECWGNDGWKGVSAPAAVSLGSRSQISHYFNKLHDNLSPPPFLWWFICLSLPFIPLNAILTHQTSFIFSSKTINLQEMWIFVVIISVTREIRVGSSVCARKQLWWRYISVKLHTDHKWWL